MNKKIEQDAVLRMARESEVSRYEVLDCYACTTSELLHFAYLIAAHEREACAKLALTAQSERMQSIREAIAAAIRARGEK